jgi:hypothetical protein
MTLSIKGLYVTLSINDTQRKKQCHYAECRYAEYHVLANYYAECHYNEWHYAECRGTTRERSGLGKNTRVRPWKLKSCYSCQKLLQYCP